MSKPSVTVIVLANDVTACTPGAAASIERTICSALDQGDAAPEVIVVDAGEVDTSSAAVQGERAVIQVLHRPGVTFGEAAGIGIAAATGNIITFLHAGDMFMPGAVSHVQDHFEDAPNTTWLAGGILHLGPEDQTLGTVTPHVPRSFTSFLMRDSGMLARVGVFWSRELLKRMGHPDARLHHAWDIDLACRAMLLGHEPSVDARILAVERDPIDAIAASQTLERELELLELATRFASLVPIWERYPLQADVNQRRKLLRQAQAEMDAMEVRLLLFGEAMRNVDRPLDPTLRHALRDSSAPETSRSAA